MSYSSAKLKCKGDSASPCSKRNELEKHQRGAGLHILYLVLDSSSEHKLLLFQGSARLYIRRRGVVGRVPAFQPGGPGSIPGEVRNINFCPGIVCVSFVFCPVLSSAEALTLC